MADVDLEMAQGVSFEVTLTYEDANLIPISLLTYRAHMQIRYLAGAAILIDLNSDPGGGIVMGGLTGLLTVYAGASQTAKVKKNAKYDLHLIDRVDPNKVLRVFGGAILLTKAITVDV